MKRKECKERNAEKRMQRKARGERRVEEGMERSRHGKGQAWKGAGAYLETRTVCAVTKGALLFRR